jgi:hypothetical protein
MHEMHTLMQFGYLGSCLLVLSDSAKTLRIVTCRWMVKENKANNLIFIKFRCDQARGNRYKNLTDSDNLV